MSFLSELFSGGVGEIVESVGGVIDQFHTSKEEKHAMRMAVEQVVTERMAVVQKAAASRFEMVASVIQSEMQSGDAYTKRARPTLVYFGMVMIFVNYLVVPMFGNEAFELPLEFWAAWGGTVAIWSVGRSAERIGKGGKVTSAITGTPQLMDLLNK